MVPWDKTVQAMIDWIEEHLDEEPTLTGMSRQIGYSPTYCSTRFRETVGVTLRSYTAGRRLCRAAIEIRDTSARILDIAVTYGFSSQEALTRAFVRAYGLTPAAYRKRPRPVVFSIKQNILFPDDANREGVQEMESILTSPNVRVEYIPAHSYIGIWDDSATCYMDFWDRHDCDKICGIVDSMENVADPVVCGHTAGWYYKDGKRAYFYGLGVPADYKGDIPEGFARKDFPGSHYLVFFHPPFDFLRDCGEVMKRVEDLAWNFDPSTKNFRWNEGVCQDYQRFRSELFGYEVLRPVVKL